MSSSDNTPGRVELELGGLHCAGCIAAVEKALTTVPGVASASVNLATAHATVILAAAAPPPAEALLAAVSRAGYQAWIATPGGPAAASADERQRRLRGQQWRLLAATVLGLPVVAVHVVPTLHPSRAGWLVLAVFTVGVFVTAAGPILVGALRALAARQANMDLLVSLGALTALLSGVIGVATHNHELILFDAAVMIVWFVALGKHLEARARGRAASALERLMARIPRAAQRVVDGRTETVPIDAVQPGDRLRVGAQTLVPVDGEIVSGRGTLNEAMLTGEALPVERAAGETVYGGTEVVDGLFELRATATGRTSAAARIAQLVADAQATKPPWQRFADRAAAVFVPVVLGLALATLAGWLWLADAALLPAVQRMIAVLVVACPCALGLAIPTAVLVGTTRAAEHGILVRNASALEAAGQVREVLLDKTGTLTLGQPALARVQLLDRADEATVLQAAAGLEQLSAHPLAQALVRAVRERGLNLPPAQDLHARPGAGLRGQVGGDQVLVGSAAWLDEHRIQTAAHAPQADALADTGCSVVWAALNGRPAALFAFSDPLHPEATAALDALRRLGIRTRILSGDRAAVVRRVAEQLGVDAYEAELTPQQKLSRVRAQAAQHGHVAMVGDGINDAPALAAASVGIAIGTGADVARAAADICLVGHAPHGIADAIRVSRRSARIMKQNLFWAVAYNLVMLPVAMLTPLPPALATAAMMCSSLTVVANSLRLRRAL
ncbi:MAG: cadmium-translocating P-type ATPase [Phycisphaerae bacterium]|nr:cadmium-translocating P-type ATPase [Phycisphaerae bacterium]